MACRCKISLELLLELLPLGIRILLALRLCVIMATNIRHECLPTWIYPSRLRLKKEYPLIIPMVCTFVL